MATDTLMDTTAMIRSPTTGLLSRKPDSDIGMARKTEVVNIPDMKNSPWAKLIIKRTPYTNVYPMAMRAYILPWAMPKTKKSIHWRGE
jgi:hypothetical protein